MVELFISCSKNYDNDEETIVGTWILNSNSTHEFINGKFLGTINETVDEGKYDILTFRPNGIFIEFYYDSNNTAAEKEKHYGTYTTEENILILKYDEDDIEGFEFALRRSYLDIIFEKKYPSGKDTYKFIKTFTFKKQ